MANLCSLFSCFLLLLLHLACFNFTSSSSHHLHSKKCKPSPVFSNKNLSSRLPSCLKLAQIKALYSSWSFFKRLFITKQSSTSTTKSCNLSRPLKKLSISSPCSSTRYLTQPIVLSLTSAHSSLERSILDSDISSDQQQFFPLRNDIYPCPICGEIFLKPNLLEQHQSVKHAVSELIDGDIDKNIVSIIFKTGWPQKVKTPIIHRIMKIHNSPKILTRFEEFRESVISNAARNGIGGRRDERCIADGNEMLRFHCTTFLCNLGQNDNSELCNQQYCNVCEIIKSGFSTKMDRISTMSTSWRAHMSIVEDIEEEFDFMHVKRVMLVCRVIAGHVGCDSDIVDKKDLGYDSLVGCKGTGIPTRLDEEDELLVFNPRAMLPCFAVVYSMHN